MLGNSNVFVVVDFCQSLSLFLLLLTSQTKDVIDKWNICLFKKNPFLHVHNNFKDCYMVMLRSYENLNLN